MPQSSAAESKSIKRTPKKDRATEIANTFEWLITAFILAFVFRAFVMEAFRIPTGSMADTLMGAHFRVRCPQCGNTYSHGYVPYDFSRGQDTVPTEPVHLPMVSCPVCAHTMRHEAFAPLKLPVDNGDRILVLKCLYQFVEPRRWDVIVFKNPTNPAENYIKRLIGLPEEEIEIVDGDIFVNGQIARKPRKVQEEHWMPIYKHDYQPVAPENPTFKNRSPWHVPFDFDDTAWSIDPAHATLLRLESSPDETLLLTYGATSANDFRATYAYNNAISYGRSPLCSDLMMQFYADCPTPQGHIGISLHKYGVDYRARIEASGTLTLSENNGTQTKILAQESFASSAFTGPILVRYAVVDRRLELTFGEQTLRYDLDGTRNGLSLDTSQAPQAQILGGGQWTLSHVALFRDIHYTSKSLHSRNGRAIQGHPFQLHADEFFVLGDNSPNSEDGRWWHAPTAANRGHTPPRAGVVPREYLVGKALLVYWPSGYAIPWPTAIQKWVTEKGQSNGLMKILRTIVKLRWIPNIGETRFIYGGTPPNSATIPETSSSAGV